jgi:hypothetical protein
MAELKEDKLEELVIDFGHLRDPQLKESFLAAFGNMVKSILKATFGSSPPKLSVRGKPAEIDAFAKALDSERRYLQTLKSLDLDNPLVHRNRAQLQGKVKDFERRTGVKWPFEV